MTHQLFPIDSHSSCNKALSDSDSESWKAERENGIALSFVAPSLAGGVALDDDARRGREGDGLSFLAAGSDESFSWDEENMSIMVRCLLHAVVVVVDDEEPAVFVIFFSDACSMSSR